MPGLLPPFQFSTASPDIDEKAIRDADPRKMCAAIARAKAHALASRLDKRAVLITADQVCHCYGRCCCRCCFPTSWWQLSSSYLHCEMRLLTLQLQKGPLTLLLLTTSFPKSTLPAKVQAKSGPREHCFRTSSTAQTDVATFLRHGRSCIGISFERSAFFCGERLHQVCLFDAEDGGGEEVREKPDNVQEVCL